MIFGDKSACMNFDRFHFCILKFFVLPLAPLPLAWLGRTIDDIPTVVPKGAESLQKKFVQEYRQQLTYLNIKAAPSDPNMLKAFDASTEGEVLGVWFNTKDMTWQLSKRKIDRLISSILNALGKSTISLHEVEVLYGRLMYFAQLGHPILIFVGEILAFMKALLDEHLSQDIRSRSRSQGSYEITPTVKHDLRTVACIIEMTRRKPLPILDKGDIVTSNSIVVYTDASGHLLDNPSPWDLCSQAK